MTFPGRSQRGDDDYGGAWGMEIKSNTDQPAALLDAQRSLSASRESGAGPSADRSRSTSVPCCFISRNWRSRAAWASGRDKPPPGSSRANL
jgi:hypothetical protein